MRICKLPELSVSLLCLPNDQAHKKKRFFSVTKLGLNWRQKCDMPYAVLLCCFCGKVTAMRIDSVLINPLK